jgi:exonuclease III
LDLSPASSGKPRATFQRWTLSHCMLSRQNTAPQAVIFDVDGTLLDSVDVNAMSWVDAFHDYGHQVRFEEVRRQIGKGGDQLMPVFMTAKEIDEYGEELEAHRGTVLKERYLPLTGDPTDLHSRYIEAAVGGVLIGCLYLPNGNPAPGPKFDYKLHWFERLTSYAATLLKLDAPVVLAGDYNVMPTELDAYKPERWLDDALFRPEVRAAFQALTKQGWTDALRSFHPGEQIFTF